MDIKDIKKIPVVRRIELAQELWDSIEPNEIALTDAMKVELDKRLELHDSGKAKYYSWEEVKAELAKKRQ